METCSIILRALLALKNPLVDHRPVSHPQPDLERLGIHGQAIRQLVAAKAIQDRPVLRFLGRQDLEGDDQAQERGVQLAVGEVGADAPVSWSTMGL